MTMQRERLMIPDCKNCAIRHLSAICHFQDEATEKAVSKVRHLSAYDKHQVVFYEGKPCTGIYLLCSGKAKLTQTSQRGRQQIVKIIGPGEVIEKNAIFDAKTHTVTCETLEPSQVCFIERHDFNAIVKKDPEMAFRLIDVLSRELEEVREKLGQRTFETARERVAEVLIELSEKYGRRGPAGIALDIPLKREEIAEMAGIVLETAVRTLGQFNQEKLVKLEGRKITLLDPERLQKISHQVAPGVRRTDKAPPLS